MKDFQGTSFNGLVALQLGKAARLAYEADDAVVRATLAQWGMRSASVRSFIPPLVDTQAFVAADSTTLIVAFRGTQEVLDFLTDAKFPQAPFSSPKGVRGAVHSGFLAGFDAAWPALNAQIRNLRDAGQAVWVTGHSLGAALATLAAARLVDDGVEVAGLYTFGSPAVGDPAFAAWFDDAMRGRAYRFVNDLDLVTRVPPEKFSPLPYRHVGEAMYFGAAGGLSRSQENFRNAMVLASLATVLVHADEMTKEERKAALLKHLSEPLADHGMDGYVTCLGGATQPLPPPAPKTASLADEVGAVLNLFKPHWPKLK